MTALQLIAGVLAVFFAIGLACAVRLSLPRAPRHDPFALPFGDMPRLPGPRQTRSGGVALRPDAGGGRRSSIPSRTAAARIVPDGGDHGRR